MNEIVSDSKRVWLSICLQELWVCYFDQINIVYELLEMVKNGHTDYLQLIKNSTKNITEDSFTDVESHQYEPQVLVKVTRKRSSYVREMPNLTKQLTLIRAVSCLEFYLNNSIEVVLKVYPNLIQENWRRKPDPLRSQMESIKGIKKKLKFLESRFRLSLKNSGFAEKQLIEIHETRNILVHNMGVVDKNYIKKVECTKLKENEDRPLTDEYVIKSVNALNQFATFLWSQIEKKFCDLIVYD